MLLGGLAAGSLAGCGDGGSSSRGGALGVYTNDTFVPGAGYYHAPARAWYSLPYNYHDPKTGLWFQGGQWAATPQQTITNISAPTVQALLAANAQRTDVHRGGFGSSSHSHFISS